MDRKPTASSADAGLALLWYMSPVEMESMVTRKALKREAAQEKSLSRFRKTPPETHDAEAFLLGEAKLEIDATLDRLGTGIEREIARMDEVLSRLRKTRILT